MGLLGFKVLFLNRYLLITFFKIKKVDQKDIYFSKLDILINSDVKPIVVFDGNRLSMKSDVED